jgi:lipoate---protein ligase
MNVIVSPFKNPFINLALEDFFLRGGVALPVVFFYVNRPCVVLGRFQNPWLETNQKYLVQNDIWMVRRQSGGGCVFQDEGNLNYSFIYPEGQIDRQKGVKFIQQAFSKAGIELEISPRHDLWLQGKKISGSAFKQIKEASFHHGTFLISSDLIQLEESLKATTQMTGSKSIPSVRSKVIKLQDLFPEIEVHDVIELIAHEAQSGPVELDSSYLNRFEVQESFKSLTNWKWLWGETPYFELPGGIIVHKGEVQAPLTGPFNQSTMASLLTKEELQNFFPDFSKQLSEQNLVF